MSTRQQRRKAQREQAKKQPAHFPTRLAVAGSVSAVAVVALLLIALASGPESAAPAGPAAPAGVRGSELPVLTLTGFDGEPVELASFLGRPLVINFWASWCIPCLAEMPGFEQVYQRRQADVEFLGINLQDDVGPALSVIQDTGITYPVARDTDGSVFVGLQAFGMPTTIWVSAEGEVLDFRTGEMKAAELEDRIVSAFDL